mmetsp:Transcript_31480/g.83932  ORF Transcript_31480/g.83932 Transcript_31480/m.83932 type:complete len:232 (+) Transcript_31480:726-1421(+)
MEVAPSTRWRSRRGATARTSRTRRSHCCECTASAQQDRSFAYPCSSRSFPQDGLCSPWLPKVRRRHSSTTPPRSQPRRRTSAATYLASGTKSERGKRATPRQRVPRPRRACATLCWHNRQDPVVLTTAVPCRWRRRGRSLAQRADVALHSEVLDNMHQTRGAMLQAAPVHETSHAHALQAKVDSLHCRLPLVLFLDQGEKVSLTHGGCPERKVQLNWPHPNEGQTASSSEF